MLGITCKKKEKNNKPNILKNRMSKPAMGVLFSKMPFKFLFFVTCSLITQGKYKEVFMAYKRHEVTTRGKVKKRFL
jgi:hypothetical protein